MVGNHSRHEPNVQAQNELYRITPSSAKEQYNISRSGSPTSATSSSQDSGWDSNQGSFVVFYDDENHAGTDR